MELNAYQDAASGTAAYPGKGTFWGLIYVSLQAASEAGEFAGKTAKLLRDDQMLHYEPTHYIPRVKRDAMIKEIGDQLWYISAQCRELGITLEECAQINLNKLADRRARGTIHGSGDDR